MQIVTVDILMQMLTSIKVPVTSTYSTTLLSLAGFVFTLGVAIRAFRLITIEGWAFDNEDDSVDDDDGPYDLVDEPYVITDTKNFYAGNCAYCGVAYAEYERLCSACGAKL